MTELGSSRVVSVVAQGARWTVLTIANTESVTWRSDDRGATFRRLDAWEGPRARDVFAVGARTFVFRNDNSLRRIDAELATLSGPAYELPCCTSVYFADEQRGFLRGYVHHMGDMKSTALPTTSLRSASIPKGAFSSSSILSLSRTAIAWAAPGSSSARRDRVLRRCPIHPHRAPRVDQTGAARGAV